MSRAEAVNKLRDNVVTRYLRETWYELKKVSWPNRKEGVNLTVMVILVTSFLAIVLGIMDWIFSSAFGLIL